MSVIISNFRSKQFIARLRFFIAAIAVFLISALYAGIKDDAEVMINQQFGKDTEQAFIKFTLPLGIKITIEREVKQRFYSEFVYAWVISTKDSIHGYALLDNVKGKTMPITFMAMYNNKGEVIHSTVLKYREPIGGEVGRQTWLKQFLGKRKGSTYEEIDAISGATISVQAVTKGIHKLTLLLDAIKTDLTNHE